METLHSADDELDRLRAWRDHGRRGIQIQELEGVFPCGVPSVSRRSRSMPSAGIFPDRAAVAANLRKNPPPIFSPVDGLPGELRSGTPSPRDKGSASDHSMLATASVVGEPDNEPVAAALARRERIDHGCADAGTGARTQAVLQYRTSTVGWNGAPARAKPSRTASPRRVPRSSPMKGRPARSDAEMIGCSARGC
jgi:hypothetical protein